LKECGERWDNKNNTKSSGLMQTHRSPDQFRTSNKSPENMSTYDVIEVGAVEDGKAEQMRHARQSRDAARAELEELNVELNAFARALSQRTSCNHPQLSNLNPQPTYAL
jgi:hypothetical protein